MNISLRRRHFCLLLIILHYTNMLKNITLSAEKKLIRKAREKAKKEDTSLNSKFRFCLEIYVNSDKSSKEYKKLMKSFSYVEVGSKFSREKMNQK
ncbi:MAG: hypothetical protein ACRENO_03045 [Thermodesulfobacteriota bacterium]